MAQLVFDDAEILLQRDFVAQRAVDEHFTFGIKTRARAAGEIRRHGEADHIIFCAGAANRVDHLAVAIQQHGIDAVVELSPIRGVIARGNVFGQIRAARERRRGRGNIFPGAESIFDELRRRRVVVFSQRAGVKPIRQRKSRAVINHSAIGKNHQWAARRCRLGN